MPNDTRDNPTLDRKGFLRTGVAGVAGAVGVGAGLTVPEASAAVTTRDAEVKGALMRLSDGRRQTNPPSPGSDE